MAGYNITITSGAQGATGQGVPSGGTTGQFLTKIDGTDYNTQWITSSATVTTISDIGDVTVVGAANGEVLTWNGSNWVNSPASGGGTWGSITGTLSSQTDLQSALDAKAASVHTHVKADITDFSDGDYATAAQGALADTALQDLTGTSIKQLSDVSDSMIPSDGQVLTYSSINGWFANSLPATADTTDWGEILGTLSDQTDLQSALDGKAASVHTHVKADITDADWISDITGEPLSSLSDVTITTIASDEILKWNGTAWINQTLAEAGIATSAQGALADSATQPGDNISTLTNDSGFISGITGELFNDLSDVNVGTPGLAQDGYAVTWDNDTARFILLDVATGGSVAWGSITGTLSNQTDLQSALDGKAASVHTHVKADITDADWISDITGESLSTLSDVTITTIASDEILKWNGTAWINQTLAEAGIAAVGHTHTTSDITDLASYTGLDVRYYTESETDTLLSGKAASVHTHVKADITDFSDGDYATAAQGALADTALQDLTGSSIKTLSDVFTTMTPIDGQVLTFDTVNGWQAETLPVDNDTTDHTLLSNIGTNTHAQIDTHIADATVHFSQASISITESQISDFGTYIPTSQKGAANGVATLDAGSKIPTIQLPALALTDINTVVDETAQLALTAQEGDIAIRTDLNKTFAHNGGVAGTMADWSELLTPTDAVLSVDGRTGAVTLNDLYATFAQGATADTATQPGDNISTLTNDSGFITALVEDTTPQLSGTLDTQGNTIDGGAGVGTFTITKSGTGNMVLDHSGTGNIVIDGLNWMTADGTSGQAILTDGAGTLGFQDVTQPGDNVSTLTNDSGFISGVAWGDITGTLSSQTDLQTALDLKADASDIIVENGFTNRTDSTLSFADVTRTFTIAPAVTSFDFWAGGVKFTKSGAENVIITDQEGIHAIYYNGGTLTAEFAPTPDDFRNLIIPTYAFVAAIYWDATNNESIIFEDERHGRTMDSRTHAYLHETVGTAFETGLELSGLIVDGNGSLDTHLQVGYAAGAIWDEDIRFDISALTAGTNIPFLYRDGVNGDWRRTVTSLAAVPTGTGRAAYNQFTGGTWQQTEVTNNDFVLTHYFATGDVNDSVMAIQGQNQYGTLGEASVGAQTEIVDLSFGQLNGLATEFKAIATVIINTSNLFSNSVKAAIVSSDTGADYIDWREEASLGSGAAGAQDHNDLAGLQGGTITERYHLTAAQAGLVDTATQPGDNVSTLTNDAGYVTSSSSTVQTTDATTTVLATIAIPLDEEKIIRIRAHGHEDATDDHIWKTLTFGVKNVGGTAILVGGTDAAVGYDAGASTWIITNSVTTSNVTITVTGEAAHTIDWRATVEID